MEELHVVQDSLCETNSHISLCKLIARPCQVAAVAGIIFIITAAGMLKALPCLAVQPTSPPTLVA